MTCRSTVELRDLQLETRIGAYAAGDTVPEYHVLDMTLSIDPRLVLIATDGMQHVFDYEPLIAEIDRLACDTHYDTQERLMTRIAAACACYGQIETAEIVLRKSPVRRGSGSLGVRLWVDQTTLASMR